MEKRTGEPCAEPSLKFCDHIRVVEKVEAEQDVAAEKLLCYFMVATAMLNAADGMNRSPCIQTLEYQASKKGFEARQQYDIGRALAAHNQVVNFIAPSRLPGGYSVVPRKGFDPSSLTQVWFI